MKKIWLSALILLGCISYAFIISSITSSSRAQETPIDSPDVLLAAHTVTNTVDDFQKSKELTEKFDFQQVSSCKSFEEIIRIFIQTYKTLHPQIREINDNLYDTGDKKIVQVNRSNNKILNASTEIGGADRPDIVQSDGNYTYYYNSEKSVISIVHSSGSLDNTKLLQDILLPSGYKSVQFFLRQKKLVVFADSYGKTVSIYNSSDTKTGALETSGSTATGSLDSSSLLASEKKFNHIQNNDESLHVIVYDISEMPNIKLERFFDLKGSMIDARVLSGELNVLSKMEINRYTAAYQRTGIEVDAGDFLPTKREVLIANGVKAQSESLFDKPSNIKCNEVFYNIPSKEILEKYPINPQIVALSKISLEAPETETKVKVIFGNTESVYLTPKSLYVQNSFYTTYPFWCANCFWGGIYNAGQNSLIHKFNIKEDLTYQTSVIVPGVPLVPRSMDENKEGYLKILTKDPITNLTTHFIVLTPEFVFYSAAQDIQPDRKYTGIQYIGDKLYLISSLTDPRVVIDLKNLHKPRVIGDAVLGGNPSYLYPYAPISGEVQYLVGVGNEPKKTLGGGGIQVNLYQMNFNERESIKSKCGLLVVEGVDENSTTSCNSSSKKCSEAQLEYETCANSIDIKNIRVETIDSISFGGDTGYSQALNDPRSIALNQSGIFVLPISSQKEIMTKSCGKIGCLNAKQSQTLFNGIKAIQIDPMIGISELITKDYKDIYSGNFVAPRITSAGDLFYFFNTKFASIIDTLNKQENVLDF